MSSELGLPPPPPPPPPAAKRRPPNPKLRCRLPAPTTITAIGDDLLREIFLRLPSLPSLVRAALACRTFLHAVRSSPAFRRRFQALRPPYILGFFRDHPGRPCIPPFTPPPPPPPPRRSDPDHTAVIRGADFFLTGITEDSDFNPCWEIETCHGGYVVLVNMITSQIAAYNPLTQVLDIFPMPPREIVHNGSLEFHIVFSQEDPGLFRVLCIEHRKTPACIAIFSSATREWTPTPQPDDGEDGGEDMLQFVAGRQTNTCVHWKRKSEDYALVLNTMTLEVSKVVFPADKSSKLFTLGHTNDGKLCVVGADGSDANIANISVWFWRVDDDAVEKWMLEDTFPMDDVVDEFDLTVLVQSVIDGFVYLSAKCVEKYESLISLCLETDDLETPFADTYASPAHLYIMAWPNSLICNKED